MGGEEEKGASDSHAEAKNAMDLSKSVQGSPPLETPVQTPQELCKNSEA